MILNEREGSEQTRMGSITTWRMTFKKGAKVNLSYLFGVLSMHDVWRFTKAINNPSSILKITESLRAIQKFLVISFIMTFHLEFSQLAKWHRIFWRIWNFTWNVLIESCIITNSTTMGPDAAQICVVLYFRLVLKDTVLCSKVIKWMDIFPNDLRRTMVTFIPIWSLSR